MVCLSKSKDDLAPTQIHSENTILKLKAKVQGRKEVMNEFDSSSHGDTLMCQIWYDSMSVKGQKSSDPNTKPCHKPYKYDLEVKGQHRIGITNVRHTLSHDDRPMC